MAQPNLPPSPWLVLPFAALLLAIACGPLLVPKLWARHYAKVAVSLGVIILGYYLFRLLAFHRVLHVVYEYVGFVSLVGALFVVSGGIHITLKGEATPWTNTLFLLLGALAANFLGTTGASMLLIRPWIRMNKYRVTAHHVVFFIFVVSNVGGCLTPIGDPPLFLGYLKGIPFWWVAKHCWPMWATATGFLLVVFYFVDSINYRRAPRQIRAQLTGAHETWRLQGLRNVLWLLVILAAVFVQNPLLLREAIMLAAAIGSWLTTPKQIHEANHFDFHPIREVAFLFFGLFLTMMPALDLVQANARRFGEPTPAVFYWSCGLLSSVLDNAPTYLTFLTAALGLVAPPQNGLTNSGEPDFALLLSNSSLNQNLLAISIAAVFFGANTYIGNAPNFMVKAIADRQKVHSPGFFGFAFKYSIPIMGPLLLLIWLLFFKRP